MTSADDFSDLGCGLFHWQAYDSASKVDLHACALAAGGGLFFIDPIALRAEAWEEMIGAAGAQPAAVLLTNANHSRAAESFRRRFSIPVFAHADAENDLGLKLDGALADGQTHPASEFQIIALPGAAAGEIALFHPAAGGLLAVGDAIIDLPSFPFALLPDKYCDDPKQLRRSLMRLLDFPFSKMTFAHGLPLMSDARKRLETLLQNP